jgi:hypothetical protein
MPVFLRGGRLSTRIKRKRESERGAHARTHTHSLTHSHARTHALKHTRVKYVRVSLCHFFGWVGGWVGGWVVGGWERVRFEPKLVSSLINVLYVSRERERVN